MSRDSGFCLYFLNIPIASLTHSPTPYLQDHDVIKVWNLIVSNVDESLIDSPPIRS